MSKALGMAMGWLWLIGLVACAPATSPDHTPDVGVAAPWRHWQPQSSAEQPENSGTKKTQPAVAGPKAVVLALHGFNDYSNAFQDFAAYARERGVAVHAYDQRGFGANPDRGLWPGVERLTADLRDATRQLRGIYGDTPLYLLGESMGGAVSIVAASGEQPLDVDGLILSAPAVWGGPHMNAFYRLTLWFASTLAPGWTLTGRGLDIRPSDNIEMLRAFGADPLVIKATRTDAIAGLVRLMDQALASAPRLGQDVLLLIGEKDEIVPPGALDDFRDRLEAARATAIHYPDGYHMLLRDLQRAKVFADIFAWIERIPSNEKDERT
ncbi:MAG: lysophospholipase [Alphaproteobacteria bacterium]|nr:lysophospholipase [Alphaproteobacteria bacterium]